MENIRSRIVFIIGALLCIIYILIPAQEGLLGDQQRNAVDVLNADFVSMVVFYLLPTLLFIAAGVMMFLNKGNKLMLVFALAGAIIFLAFDIRFAMNHQAYPGCYINAIGAVIAMAGAAMTALGSKPEEGKEEEEEEIIQADDKMQLYYEKFEEDRPETVESTNNEEIDFGEIAEAEGNSTEFFSGIEDMFLDEAQTQEELFNESKESTGNSDITDHGSDHEYSNDSFWS